MLGNPPMPPLGMELGEDTPDVENYEVGLSINFCFFTRKLLLCFFIAGPQKTPLIWNNYTIQMIFIL